MNHLEKIRKIMLEAFKQASEVATDYHQAFDMNLLDSANDFKKHFSDDQQVGLNNISTVLWQTLIAGIEWEDVFHGDPEDDAIDAFDAIFQQIAIAHFG